VVNLVTTPATPEKRMRCAILGWGSLVWDARKLSDQIVDGHRGQDAWNLDGPTLPIEFSRVSGWNTVPHLSLVIDPRHGEATRVRYVLSKRSTLEDAIGDLRTREDTVSANIGFVDLRTRVSRALVPAVIGTISTWAAERDVDAAIWTDLAPNFTDKKKLNRAFTPEEAISFLRERSGESLAKASSYMVNAPPEVDTPVRRLARETGWLPSDPAGEA
jgi:hypothetical protein